MTDILRCSPFSTRLRTIVPSRQHPSFCPVLALLAVSIFLLPLLVTLLLVTTLPVILLGSVSRPANKPLPPPGLTRHSDLPSVASTIGKAAIVVLVMFSYPLQVHPCRASVDAVLKWRPASRKQAEYTSANGSPSRSSLLHTGNLAQKGRGEMSDRRFALITTVIIILSYIVAMTVSSLAIVLAYVGSTGSTSISFILPGLFYYKISSPDSPHHQRLLKEDDDEEADIDAEAESGWSSGSIIRKLSLGLAIYGLLVMVVCLITNTFFIVAH